MEDTARHKKRTRMEMADSRTQVNKCARERHTCVPMKGVGAKGGEYHGHGRGMRERSGRRGIPRTTAPTGNIHIPIPDVGTACGTDVFRAVTLRP